MTTADVLARELDLVGPANLMIEALDEISDRLAVAFMKLHRAAAIDHYLVDADAEYSGGDVAVAIHETLAAIDNAVSAHELADGQLFWGQAANAASVASSHTLATLPLTVDIAADLMIDHLGGALDSLLGAKLHTDDASIDNAISAVCRALSAAVKL